MCAREIFDETPHECDDVVHVSSSDFLMSSAFRNVELCDHLDQQAGRLSSDTEDADSALAAFRHDCRLASLERDRPNQDRKLSREAACAVS